MSKKNKTVPVITDVFRNKYTGASIRMAPAGTLDGEPAWLVKDKCLSNYALDNFSLGMNKGIRAGGATGLLVGVVLGGALALAAALSSDDKKKGDKKEA